MNDDKLTVLDQPDQIRAFALLQVYFKLKLEVENPAGPKWRMSPMKMATEILAKNDIVPAKRTKKCVFDAYHKYLRNLGILEDA